MLKKFVICLLLISSLFGQNELWKFFKYSTAYTSFSLNAPRHQDDRFRIVGGLDTGDLEIERDERELESDFQKSLFFKDFETNRSGSSTIKCPKS